MADLCNGFAQWASELPHTAVPEDAAQAVRRALVDVTGCMIAGATTPVAQTLRHQSSGIFVPGRCRVLGEGLRITPVGAALLNGTAGAALELDCGMENGRVAAAGPVFAAVLAICEQTGAGRPDMFAGMAIGLEVAARLAYVMRDSLDADNVSLAAMIGSAAGALGAARALRMDPDAGAHAMRIAIATVGGMRATAGTSVRPLLMGMAAENAVRAVLLADSGMGGPVAILEGPHGFGRCGSPEKPLNRALVELGHLWLVAKPGLVFRLHPAGVPLLPALEETARLLAEHRLPPADVASITCHVAPAVTAALQTTPPQTMAQAQYNLKYVIACLLSFGTYGISHLKRSVMSGPTLVENSSKIVVTEANRRPGDDTHLSRTPFAAKVTIQSTQGQTLRGLGRVATGYPERPLTDRIVEDKFVANTRFAGLDEAQARLMAERMWDMPD